MFVLDWLDWECSRHSKEVAALATWLNPISQRAEFSERREPGVIVDGVVSEAGSPSKVAP